MKRDSEWEKAAGWERGEERGGESPLSGWGGVKSPELPSSHGKLISAG